MGLERSVVAFDNVEDGRWSWLATGIVPSVGDICIGGAAPVALNRSRRFASPSPADPIIQGRFDL